MKLAEYMRLLNQHIHTMNVNKQSAVPKDDKYTISELVYEISKYRPDLVPDFIKHMHYYQIFEDTPRFEFQKQYVEHTKTNQTKIHPMSVWDSSSSENPIWKEDLIDGLYSLVHALQSGISQIDELDEPDKPRYSITLTEDQKVLLTNLPIDQVPFMYYYDYNEACYRPVWLDPTNRPIEEQIIISDETYLLI